jgi:hypothetical protein
VPDFHIDGDAGAIRGRTAQMRTKGQTFVDTGDALAKISTGGWTGRAADKFADKFDAEPERWRKAGDGFVDAAAALETYADALDDAKRRADWAKDEYARGDRESESARTAYDADVSRARQEVADAAAEGTHMPLTILPFKDPGDAIRKNALDELSSAKADLEKAAHVAADGVRAGAANAPEKRKWYEKIGAAVGGFLTGAGEAVWDLLTMSSFSPINMLLDTHQLATGDMTPEELAAKYRMSVESVGDMVDALKEDPAEFGKQLGKGLLDWDTWADDPARALGHLVPDAVAAFFTAGAGTAATRGVKGTADAVDALSDMSKSTRALDDLGDLGKADDLGDLSKLDDLGDLNKLDGMGHPDHLSERSLDEGPRDLDDQLRDPSYSPQNRDIIENDYDPLGGMDDPEEFKGAHWGRDTGDPDYPTDWYWPDHDGAVPGSTEVVPPSGMERLDRVGGGGGEYFSPADTPMGQRSLPPDRLNFDRNYWDVDRTHPDLSSPANAPNHVSIERSDIAGAFGQDGGGVQYRFMRAGEDGDLVPIPQHELKELGIIKHGGRAGG